MGLALFKERRVSDRRKLTGLLPGRLLLTEGKVDVACRPLDVSRNGMGIVLSQELKPGTLVTLVLAEREIGMKIAWGQPDFGKQDMFRYGLVTLDPNEDLEAVFVHAGCLR